MGLLGKPTILGVAPISQLLKGSNSELQLDGSSPIHAGRKALLCGDFEERQRARALLELLPKAPALSGLKESTTTQSLTFSVSIFF